MRDAAKMHDEDADWTKDVIWCAWARPSLAASTSDYIKRPKDARRFADQQRATHRPHQRSSEVCTLLLTAFAYSAMGHGCWPLIATIDNASVLTVARTLVWARSEGVCWKSDTAELRSFWCLIAVLACARSVRKSGLEYATGC